MVFLATIVRVFLLLSLTLTAAVEFEIKANAVTVDHSGGGGGGGGGGSDSHPSSPSSRELRQLRGLRRMVHKHTPNFRKSGTVAVGFGGCLDSVVAGVPLLEALGFDGYEEVSPRHHGAVRSALELAELFAYFFEKGAAAERYVVDKALFSQLVELSRTLDPSLVRPWMMGGNAATMANRMAKEGVNVVLGASGSADLTERLHARVRTVGDMPEGGADDVHLILEYRTGERWGQFVAPRANRLALHSDTANAELWALPALEKEVDGDGDGEGAESGDITPAMVVFGGLHLMESYPFEGKKEEKQAVHETETEKAHAGMHKLLEVEHFENIAASHKVPVHFEFASVSDLSFMQALNETALASSDSIGCNEQELTILHQFYEDGSMAHSAEHTPRVAVVLDQMRDVFNTLKRDPDAEGRGGHGRLSRLHVHTLAYQAIMTSLDPNLPDSRVVVGAPAAGGVGEKEAGEHESGWAWNWRRTSASAALSSLTATHYVCGHGNDPAYHGGGSYTEEEERRLAGGTYVVLDESFGFSAKDLSRGRMQLDDDNPVTCWDEADHGVHVCIAPVLVCRKPSKTIGAGDNISGASLVAQL